MNGHVYKITNIKSGRFYIGYTQATLKDRFRQHVKRSKCKNKFSQFYVDLFELGKDQFKIETSAFANGILQLIMTDLQGKIVLSQKIGFVKNKPISVQTNDFPSGIYVVQLSQNGKVVTEKLVISN